VRETKVHTETKSCWSCGGVSPPGATYCTSCYLPFVTQPRPATPRVSTRRTAWVGPAAALLALVGLVAGVLHLRADHGLRTPSSIGGYSRIVDPQTRPIIAGLLSAMQSRNIIHPVAAFYGTTPTDAASAVLLLNAGRVSHQVVDRRGFLSSFASGYAAGSGSSLDVSRAFDRTFQGVTVTCASRVGRGGAVCVWEDPTTILLMIGFPQLSVDDAVRLTVEARSTLLS